MKAAVAPSVQQAILAGYKAGDPVRVIADRHGVSIAAVSKLANGAGVRHRKVRTWKYCCTACRKPVPTPDTMCDFCTVDVPLTGGRWVKNHRGILRYVPDPAEDAS